jgi:hypothetical protein
VEVPAPFFFQDRNVVVEKLLDSVNVGEECFAEGWVDGGSWRR